MSDVNDQKYTAELLSSNLFEQITTTKQQHATLLKTIRKHTIAFEQTKVELSNGRQELMELELKLKSNKKDFEKKSALRIAQKELAVKIVQNKQQVVQQKIDDLALEQQENAPLPLRKSLKVVHVVKKSKASTKLKTVKKSKKRRRRRHVGGSGGGGRCSGGGGDEGVENEGMKVQRTSLFGRLWSETWKVLHYSWTHVVFYASLNMPQWGFQKLFLNSFGLYMSCTTVFI